MIGIFNKGSLLGPISRRLIAAVGVTVLVGSLVAIADDFGRNDHGNDRDHDGDRFERPVFVPGNLVVSRSVYDNRAANVTVGEHAAAKLRRDHRWLRCLHRRAQQRHLSIRLQQRLSDASFGITSRIFLDQITPFGLPHQHARSPQQPRSAASRARAISSSPASARSRSSRCISRPTADISHSWATSRRSTRSTSPTPIRRRAIDPTNPVGRRITIAPSPGRRMGTLPLHRDQRVQRQQRPLRDSQRHGRRRLSSTPPATPATAANPSRPASSSAQARSSSTLLIA